MTKCFKIYAEYMGEHSKFWNRKYSEEYAILSCNSILYVLYNIAYYKVQYIRLILVKETSVRQMRYDSNTETVLRSCHNYHLLIMTSPKCKNEKIIFTYSWFSKQKFLSIKQKKIQRNTPTDL